MGSRAERVYANPTWLLKYGSDHPRYVENPSYNAIHSYIKRRLPKADHCWVCDEVKLLDLANLSGNYSRETSDWGYLCRSCHRKHDYRLRYGNKCRNGHEYTEATIYVHNGKKACKTCRSESTRRMRARVKKLRAEDPIKYLGENI